MLFTMRILAGIAALGLLAGTAAPVQGTDADGERYSVYVGDFEYITFDGNGRRVEPEESGERVDVLEDVMTGEPRYRVRTRTEDTGERDEYGTPKVRTLCALYDLEDKLLLDWAPYGYEAGFGDYLIRMDGELYANRMMLGADDKYYSGLWNWKTGEELLPGVTRVQKVDDDTVLPHVSSGKPLPGVLELGGGTPVLRPFPQQYHDASVWRGQIIAAPGARPKEKEDMRKTLLAPDLTPLITQKNLNGGFHGLRGPYLLYTDADDTTGILSEKLEPLYTEPEGESLDYFDGELVLLHRIEDPKGKRTFIRRMIRTDGTVLAEGYDKLSGVGDGSWSEQREPAQQFIGVRGDRVELLDRNGQVTASREIPRLESVRSMVNGLIGYEITTPDPSDDDGQSNVRCGLLDSKLNMVLEAGPYANLQEVYGNANREELTGGLLQGMKYLAGGIQRTDILDSTGKLLIENLTHAGTAGPNRIAVVKGFSVGLMDWQGNWIAKESIFDKLEDEEGRMLYR